MERVKPGSYRLFDEISNKTVYVCVVGTAGCVFRQRVHKNKDNLANYTDDDTDGGAAGAFGYESIF